ncbi:MAG: GntR family transcriptional regulator [Xenophilus sp.]
MEQQGSLWGYVHQDLERRLAAGEFGERFPTDRELMAHYHAGRHTVRRAVEKLGSVQRRPRLGGQVRRDWGALARLVRSLRALGPGVEIEAAGGSGVQQTQVHLVRLHGEALALSILAPEQPGDAVPAEVAALALALAGSDEAGAAAPADIAPEAAAIEPVLASAEAAQALGITPGSPVFRVTTQLLRAGAPFARHACLIRPDRARCILSVDFVGA